MLGRLHWQAWSEFRLDSLFLLKGGHFWHDRVEEFDFSSVSLNLVEAFGKETGVVGDLDEQLQL